MRLRYLTTSARQRAPGMACQKSNFALGGGTDLLQVSVLKERRQSG